MRECATQKCVNERLIDQFSFITQLRKQSDVVYSHVFELHIYDHPTQAVL